MTETVCSGGKTWQASATEVQKDMQLLGHSQSRELRPKSQTVVSTHKVRIKRDAKLLGPFLGLATFLLEWEAQPPKPKRKKKQKLLRLPRAATHVAIAYYLARHRTRHHAAKS